jgi:hypothetical protein
VQVDSHVLSLHRGLPCRGVWCETRASQCSDPTGSGGPAPSSHQEVRPIGYMASLGQEAGTARDHVVSVDTERSSSRCRRPHPALPGWFGNAGFLADIVVLALVHNGRRGRRGRGIWVVSGSLWAP